MMAITAGPIFALVLREQEEYYPKLKKQSRGLRKPKPLHVQAANTPEGRLYGLGHLALARRSGSVAVAYD